MIKLEKQIFQEDNTYMSQETKRDKDTYESVIILRSRKYKDFGFSNGDNFDLIYQVKPVKRVSDLFSDGLVNSTNLDRTVLRLLFSNAEEFTTHAAAYQEAQAQLKQYPNQCGIELITIDDEY